MADLNCCDRCGIESEIEEPPSGSWFGSSLCRGCYKETTGVFAPRRAKPSTLFKEGSPTHQLILTLGLAGAHD